MIYPFEGILRVGKLDMIENDEKTKSGATASYSFAVRIPTVLILMAVLVYIFSSKMDRPIHYPHILASPYVWPNGCEKRDYESGFEKISASCADKAYKFPDASKYGFLYGRGGEYYRVDNDVILIDCEARGSCYKTRVVKHIFHQ